MGNKKRIFILLAIMLALGVIIRVFADNSQTVHQKVVATDSTILLYSRENCFYCKLAKQLLDSKNLKYEHIDISNNVDLHSKMIDQTGQRTVPYVFIDGEFIGGYTELKKHLAN